VRRNGTVVARVEPGLLLCGVDQVRVRLVLKGGETLPSSIQSGDALTSADELVD